MDFHQALINWCTEMQRDACPPGSRLEFLVECVFDLATYDSEVSEFLGAKAVEVFRAITEKTTFDYIKNEENHRWFITVCNLPFFINRIDWGSSIRGAWWDGDQQCVGEIEMGGRWPEFAQALLKFADER